MKLYESLRTVFTNMASNWMSDILIVKHCRVLVRNADLFCCRARCEEVSGREEGARNKLAQLQDAKIAADQEVSSRCRSCAGRKQSPMARGNTNTKTHSTAKKTHHGLFVYEVRSDVSTVGIIRSSHHLHGLLVSCRSITARSDRHTDIHKTCYSSTQF